MDDNIGEKLDLLYHRYNSREFVDPDPLVYLYDYPEVRDREVVGLIASSLAFGGVKQIMRSVERVLRRMGGSPADYILSENPAEIEGSLNGFKHRWITCVEVSGLIHGIRKVIERHGSVEKCLVTRLDDAGGDMSSALSLFVSDLETDSLRPGFLPDSNRGSACKRLNLYLRWMVRHDDVDPGGWDDVPASKLIVPLDTHMYRLAQLMGFTDRKQKDLRTAIEITRAFARFSPDDPVKYDFALTRLGIRCDDDRDFFVGELTQEGAFCD